jgi:hypothetical protein
MKKSTFLIALVIVLVGGGLDWLVLASAPTTAPRRGS